MKTDSTQTTDMTGETAQAQFEPQTLKRWTRPDSYMGAEWPSHYGAGVGQHRDSGALARSNFESVKAALKRLDETAPFDSHGQTDDNGEEISSRFVVSESHWAVGWVEWIAIHETDAAALKLCDEIATGMEDYPVVNEEHYSQTEMDEANETWKACYNWRERVKYIREHARDFEFHGFADIIGCVRGNYFGGEYSSMCS